MATERIPPAFRRLLLMAALALAGAAISTLLDWPSAGADAEGGPTTIAVTGTLAERVGNELSVSMVLTSETPATVRAWYVLALPGDPEPWRTFEYMSAVEEVQLEPGRPHRLSWREPLVVRDGRYEVTAWVHRNEGGEWLHAAGGPFEFGQFGVQGNGVRFAMQHGGAAATFAEPVLAPEGDALLVTVEPGAGVESVGISWAFTPREGNSDPISGTHPTPVRRTEVIRIPLPGAPAVFDLMVIATPAGEGDTPAQVAHYYGVAAK